MLSNAATTSGGRQPPGRRTALPSKPADNTFRYLAHPPASSLFSPSPILHRSGTRTDHQSGTGVRDNIVVVWFARPNDTLFLILYVPVCLTVRRRLSGAVLFVQTTFHLSWSCCPRFTFPANHPPLLLAGVPSSPSACVSWVERQTGQCRIGARRQLTKASGRIACTRSAELTTATRHALSPLLARNRRTWRS